MKLFFLFLSLLCAAAADITPYDVINDADDWCEVGPTGSMRPSITEVHWVMYKHVPFKDLRVGDVILVKLKTPIDMGRLHFETYCHRILSISSGGSVVATKGDANETTDTTLVSEDMYVGVVVAIVRRPNLP